MQGNNYMTQEQPGPELEHKTKKTADKFSETLNVIANEPSLAFFRIQEHVRKSLPQLVDKKHEVEDLQQCIQGACFDVDYATKAVATMDKSASHFRQTQELLKNSMFIKQQLQYESGRRQNQKSRPSMYRAILRTQTLDLPISPDTNHHSANDLTHTVQVSTTNEDSGTPRTRSSSLSSHNWVAPASLLR